MKKILYICGINWRWIFQRPQILALELEKYFDITVLYPQKIIRLWRGQKYTRTAKQSKVFIEFPFQNKIYLLKKISQLFLKKEFRKSKNYDIIWFGYPQNFSLLPKDYNGIVIYDCMDNHYSMIDGAKQKQQLLKNEVALFQRADIIFVSSFALREYVAKYVERQKIYLIRNGLLDSKVYPVNSVVSKSIYKIGYVGTIEQWLDYESLISSLEEFQDVEYHLVGPNMVCTRNVKGIIYDGVIEHQLLFSHIKGFDCLIMPFKVTETIKAVDPVKLYEYISWGKCIISVFYPEIERFQEFVYFYNTPDDYIDVLKELKIKGFPPKYNEIQQREFLSANLWKKRAKQIYSIIQGATKEIAYESNECIRNQT